MIYFQQGSRILALQIHDIALYNFKGRQSNNLSLFLLAIYKRRSGGTSNLSYFEVPNLVTASSSALMYAAFALSTLDLSVLRETRTTSRTASIALRAALLSFPRLVEENI